MTDLEVFGVIYSAVALQPEVAKRLFRLSDFKRLFLFTESTEDSLHCFASGGPESNTETMFLELKTQILRNDWMTCSGLRETLPPRARLSCVPTRSESHDSISGWK